MRKKFTSAIVAYLLLSTIMFGQVPSSAPVPEKTGTADEALPAKGSGTHEMTPADIEAFLDGIVPLELARQDIGGAVITIVKDGKPFFAKGYGYSNVKEQKPVSPSETLFRPGSISKLFTWTAVMQLVEQGKLDLNRDVNEYLDFKIPDAFGQPITLTNILTHTAGFEEQVKDLITFEPKSPDLGQYLKTHIPSRIFPPGKVPAYSNYATALAGYIVQRISGEPFEQYISEHIFEPLGMTHSTFLQPLPPELVPFMSEGYELASGEPKRFEIIPAGPAGALSSSGDDMAKFMLAHLQQGRLGDAQILKPETVKLMHSPLFGLDPAANSMAHGFYEESRNGHRIIGHGGDTIYFHSDLHLVQDAGLGFFISFNSAGRGLGSPRAEIWHAFLDRYFPYTPPAIAVPDTAKQDAASVSGSYMVSRRGDGFLKAFAIIGETTVAPAEDGTIMVADLLDTNGKPKHWQDIGGMKFREVNGQDLLVFKPDENGRMQLIIPYPFMVFKRVGIWENNAVLMPVLVVSLAVMLLTLILWFVGWLVRRRYGKTLELPRFDMRLRWAVRAVFALAIIFVVSLLGLLMYGIQNLDFLGGTGGLLIQLSQVVGIIASAGMLVVFFNAFHAWRSSIYGIWGKLQATLFALAALGFLWFAFAGHLLYISSNF